MMPHAVNVRSDGQNSLRMQRQMHSELQQISLLMKKMRRFKDSRAAWRAQAIDDENFFMTRSKHELFELMEADLQDLHDQLAEITGNIIAALHPPGLERASAQCIQWLNDRPPTSTA